MHVDLSKHVRPIDTHAVCHTHYLPAAQPAPLSIAPPQQHRACTCLSVADDSCVCRPKTSPTVGRGVYFQSSFDFGRFACIILDNSMRDSAFLVSPELTGGVYDVKYLFQSLIPNTSHGSAASVTGSSVSVRLSLFQPSRPGLLVSTAYHERDRQLSLALTS